MENLREIFASGSEYDAAIAETGTKFLEGRVPHLGQRMRYRDGREFVFCSTEADFVAGEMVAINQLIATESANIGVVTSAGSSTLQLDTTGVNFGGGAGILAANKLAGGFIALTDDTGEGYLYKIKSHIAGTAAIQIIFTLYDPIKVAVGVNVDVCFVVNPFALVKEGTATSNIIGSAMVPTTASTDGVVQYFWVQCKGPAICLGSGTVGVPIASAAAGAVADSVEAGSGAYDTIVGTGISTTANGYVVVWLNLGI